MANQGGVFPKGVSGMRERNKPTQPWIAKSKHEIENADRLLAERIEKVKEIRVNKLLYQDSEAFKVGYEAGFATACELLHDFAKTVYEMMQAQHDESIMNARLTYKGNSGVKVEEEEYVKHNELILHMYEYEGKVRTWIKENYPQLMED